MLKFIAHDTINDIALGLQQTKYSEEQVSYAIKDFYDCQRHALAHLIEDSN